MRAYSMSIPRLSFHHQVLLNAIEGVLLIKLSFLPRREIAQTRVFLVTYQAKITEQIEIFRNQLINALQWMLRVVMFHRTSESELIGFHGFARTMLKPQQVIQEVKHQVVFDMAEAQARL